jgi:thioredoxin 2
MTTMIQAVCPSCGSVNRIAEGRSPAAAKCGRCSDPLRLDAPIEVDDAGLARHLERTAGLVLVDVWAPWCGPCRAMAPQFAQAARLLGGHARLLKLNVDDSGTARHLGISGVPALLLFRDGRVIDRKAGLMHADALAAWVRDHMSSTAATIT